MLTIHVYKPTYFVFLINNNKKLLLTLLDLKLSIAKSLKNFLRGEQQRREYLHSVCARKKY